VSRGTREMRLTSQDRGSRVLHGSQTGTELSRKAIPDFLGKIPGAEVSRVVAESVSILGADSAR